MERITCKIVATLILLLALHSFALAQTPTIIKIIHTPPTVDQLPALGDELKLTFSLEGTRSFDQQVRAVVVRDGKLFEIVPTESTVDANDKPRFTFSINAPYQTLSYQFVVMPTTGNSISSERFNITRDCLPRNELTQVNSELFASDDYVILSKLSNGLEKDIHTYEVLSGVIEDIVSLLEKPGDKK